jgi:sortase (surface protein transpeptidase)
VRVRIGAADSAAAVVPVGVDDRGQMAVPEDVQTVGWYRFGPPPGAPVGSSVLSGHVDDQVQGRGAFFRLVELAPGDTVQVQLSDGAMREFRVRTVERIAKAELPLDELFARAGPPRLTLITCGGEFDRAAGSYRDNIVVTAEPVGR